MCPKIGMAVVTFVYYVQCIYIYVLKLTNLCKIPRPADCQAFYRSVAQPKLSSTKKQRIAFLCSFLKKYYSSRLTGIASNPPNQCNQKKKMKKYTRKTAISGVTGDILRNFHQKEQTKRVDFITIICRFRSSYIAATSPTLARQREKKQNQKKKTQTTNS